MKRAPLKKVLIYGLILVVAASLGYYGYRERVKWKKEHVLVELRSVQGPKGWGYDILANGKVFIHQPIIPAIPGQYAFRTEGDALAVGQKVVDRIKEGKMPMVTAREVQEMGLVPDSVRSASNSVRSVPDSAHSPK